MAQRPKRKQRKVDEGSPTWMTSFADMTNLVLCFFLALYALSQESLKQNEAIIGVAMQGFGSQSGGATLQQGQMLNMGNTILSLPSSERGRSLAQAKKTATSIFQTELKSKYVRISQDERGLIISLSAELFFAPSSATLNMEEANVVLRKVAQLLNDDQLKKNMNRFRVEGHTDRVPTDPDSPFETNWELSAARALSVLHYLVNVGVDETRMQVAGLADTRPVPGSDQNTEEGRAVNRRIDIVILSEGHL
ncbi:MAG: flagellar motor protein MotB [Spirochaetaceae bacterium]|nr:MAG: flagellar motor protein MotB [Spirochaetaceae bacterium]